MKLQRNRRNPGARKTRLRIGRGIGSGKGKTGGRGGKGQTARSGVRSRASRAARCRYIAACPSAASRTPSGEAQRGNVGSIQQAIDAGSSTPGATVDAAALVKAGMMRRAKDGVRLLGDGEIKAKVEFEVYGASKSAVAAVEKAGGSVKILAPKPEEGEKAA